MARKLEYVGSVERFRECMKHPDFWDINEDARLILVTAVQCRNTIKTATLAGMLMNYTSIGENSFSLWDPWVLSEESEPRRPRSKMGGYELDSIHVPLEQITEVYFLADKNSIGPCLPRALPYNSSIN